MPEPAKDTAIENTPKAPPVLSRVQSIVQEINRATTSRAGGRNKKEDNCTGLVRFGENCTPGLVFFSEITSDGSFAHLSAHVFRFFSASSSSEEKHTTRVINT